MFLSGFVRAQEGLDLYRVYRASSWFNKGLSLMGTPSSSFCIYLFVFLYLCLSACLPGCPSVCLSGLSGLSVGFGTGSWGLPVSSFGVCDPNSWPLGFRVVRFKVSASGFSVCRSRRAARKVLLA